MLVAARTMFYRRDYHHDQHDYRKRTDAELTSDSCVYSTG